MNEQTQRVRDQGAWVESLDPMRGFDRFFDYLPGVSVFAKDKEGRLTMCNAQFLARFDLMYADELIGLTDYDLFPKAMADNYRKDDREVMRTKEPKLNIIEIFFNRQGLPDWYLANKLPAFSRDGEVIGVMGIIKSHRAKSGFGSSHPYARLAPAIESIQRNFRKKLSISDLADLTNLSCRQFGRCFKEYYGVSPQTFLIKTRVQAACELLRDRNVDLANLAVELGFYDQSSFTQHFRRHMGITPRRFREQEGR